MSKDVPQDWIAFITQRNDVGGRANSLPRLMHAKLQWPHGIDWLTEPTPARSWIEINTQQTRHYLCTRSSVAVCKPCALFNPDTQSFDHRPHKSLEAMTACLPVVYKSDCGVPWQVNTVAGKEQTNRVSIANCMTMVYASHVYKLQVRKYRNHRQLQFWIWTYNLKFENSTFV